jgi:hypothetical protein
MKHCKPLAYHENRPGCEENKQQNCSQLKSVKDNSGMGDNCKRIMLTNWRLIHCFAEACKEKFE